MVSEFWQLTAFAPVACRRRVTTSGQPRSERAPLERIGESPGPWAQFSRQYPKECTPNWTAVSMRVHQNLPVRTFHICHTSCHTELDSLYGECVSGGFYLVGGTGIEPVAPAV